MKHQHVLSILFAGLISIAASPNVQADQIQLPERVFAPVGFDSNDDAQVVLYGHFPSTCYQAGPAEALVRGQEIQIRNSALRAEDPNCLQVSVPWMTTVHLGSLAAGSYRIVVESPNGRMIDYTALDVAPSRSRQADDYLYAYVNGALVNRARKTPVLTISGSFSLTCMEIARIQMKETAGTIVVLPIVRLRTDVKCAHPFVPIPFSENIVLRPKSREATLIHIRSVNGQALNQVIEN